MKKGLIPIAKIIDWSKIRAEYIGGGISQRKLAQKYGVSETTLMKKANREGWQHLRSETDSKSVAQAQQKTADAVSSNAVLAQDIKHKLLLRLKRIESKYPSDATEVRQKRGNDMEIFRVRDLTAAFADLTKDMVLDADIGSTVPTIIDDIPKERDACD